MPLTFSLPSPCSRGSGAASHRERRTSEGSRPDTGGTPHSPRSRRASSRIGPETPENAYLAIGGDYNTQHHNEECLATLSSATETSPGQIRVQLKGQNTVRNLAVGQDNPCAIALDQQYVYWVNCTVGGAVLRAPK